MGAHILTNGTLFVGSHDFSGDSNEVRLQMEADEKECTTFGSGGAKEYKAGLKGGEWSAKGFWVAGADSQDEYASAKLGTVDEVATWCQTGVAGDVAYFGRFGEFSYDRGGPIGELAPFSINAKNTQGQGVARGMLAAAKQTVNATGVLGSVLALGAPTSTQYVYAVLHTFGTAGTTITVQVQSDDAAGFSSPTTRGTFTGITTATGTWLARIAGPFVAETHWRMNVSAITGTWSVAGAIAVQ